MKVIFYKINYIKMKYLVLSIFLFLFLNQNIEAQCFKDRHNTSWYEGWISCDKSLNPNPIRGVSHWIMYDLNYTYKLGKTHFWNTNSTDILSYGIRNAIIDISIDGINWQQIENFDIPQADGTSTYEGVAGPDFHESQARYLLITGISNWGGQCFGLSEVKFEVLGVNTSSDQDLNLNQCLQSEIFPNPASISAQLNIYTKCSSKDIMYEVQDISGRIIMQGIKKVAAKYSPIDLDISGLVNGMYIIVVSQNGFKTKGKLIKM